VAYSRWWLERRGVRRWPTARQWQHGRRGLGSGEKPVMLGHHMRLGARVGAREELWCTGLPRARAEQGVHRRRLARVREGVEGGFISLGARRGGCSQRRGLQWQRHGVEAVGDVRPADGQWRKAARAGASVLWPRGTGLSFHACVMGPRGTMAAARASDRWSLRRLGVRARTGYGATDMAGAQRDVARGSPKSKTVRISPL
jgi:formylglycine-generating enzyme required for sulfatase activity